MFTATGLPTVQIVPNEPIWNSVPELTTTLPVPVIGTAKCRPKMPWFTSMVPLLTSGFCTTVTRFESVLVSLMPVPMVRPPRPPPRTSQRLRPPTVLSAVTSSRCIVLIWSVAPSFLMVPPTKVKRSAPRFWLLVLSVTPALMIVPELTPEAPKALPLPAVTRPPFRVVTPV